MKSLQISEFISEVGTDNGTQDISSLSESESSSVVSDSLWPHGLYSSWNPPGQNTEVGSLSFLQGIFPTQGSNPSLPHCRQILYQLNHKGSPRILKWVASLFSSGSSWPRNQIGVSCIAGGFFTSWETREAHHISITTQKARAWGSFWLVKKRGSQEIPRALATDKPHPFTHCCNF